MLLFPCLFLLWRWPFITLLSRRTSYYLLVYRGLRFASPIGLVMAHLLCCIDQLSFLYRLRSVRTAADDDRHGLRAPNRMAGSGRLQYHLTAIKITSGGQRYPENAEPEWVVKSRRQERQW